MARHQVVESEVQKAFPLVLLLLQVTLHRGRRGDVGVDHPEGSFGVAIEALHRHFRGGIAMAHDAKDGDIHTRHNSSRGVPEIAIRLVSVIGVKAPRPLVGHFLDHYRDQGVDDILVVLHAPPGDCRFEAMRALLEKRGIRPVQKIGEYSAKIKKAIFEEIVARLCAPDDWVVYADVDELQVYPADIPSFLAAREQFGHRFVRGRMVDRIADGGELLEIREEPSLQEQFPLSADIGHRICGAWDRKVCAAKARVPLSDGGAHAVDHGFPRVGWNYRWTHRMPWRREPTIEILHFKWDATLAQRLHDKLAGIGGDVDYRDGPGFMREYRALADHLDRHGGRLEVPAE